MARKIREKEADICYEDDLVDMIDQKLDSQPSIKSSMRVEDDQDLQQAYKDLNLQGYITDSKDTTHVAPHKKPEPVLTKPKLASNPFEGKEDECTPTYNDVVDTDYATPRLDVRTYQPVPIKKSSSRLKLWLTTGICGVCLLASATLIGVFGVGPGAGTQATSNNNVEFGELASDQGIINKTDTNLTDDQVRDWLSGNNLPNGVTTGKTTNTNTNQDAITSSSVWDKFCDFFSRLFGR